MPENIPSERNQQESGENRLVPRVTRDVREESPLVDPLFGRLERLSGNECLVFGNGMNDVSLERSRVAREISFSRNIFSGFLLSSSKNRSYCKENWSNKAKSLKSR